MSQEQGYIAIKEPISKIFLFKTETERKALHVKFASYSRRELDIKEKDKAIEWLKGKYSMESAVSVLNDADVIQNKSVAASLLINKVSDPSYTQANNDDKDNDDNLHEYVERVESKVSDVLNALTEEKENDTNDVNSISVLPSVGNTSTNQSENAESDVAVDNPEQADKKTMESPDEDFIYAAPTNNDSINSFMESFNSLISFVAKIQQENIFKPNTFGCYYENNHFVVYTINDKGEKAIVADTLNAFLAFELIYAELLKHRP